VPEPSVEETVAILRRPEITLRGAPRHQIQRQRAHQRPELSARYINDRHLPDKAIDVIDEAGAAQKILPKSKQKKVVGKTEIEEIISKIARIPPRRCRRTTAPPSEPRPRPESGRVRAGPGHRSSGVRDPHRTLGSCQSAEADRGLSILGPDRRRKNRGRAPARVLHGIELHRFDMSEYMERHAVSRLIGAPPAMWDSTRAAF